jgi:inner membrane transporter RhtA
VVLLALSRPQIRGRSRQDWAAAALLGLILAVMNLSFYGAIARLPLGVVVTIEFLGPLGLAAAVSRRPRDVAAVAVALLGVVAVSGVLQVDVAALDLVGLGLAAAAGGCWAGYILATRTVGRRWEQLDGLAVAMIVGAVLITPFAAVQVAGSALTAAQVGVGAAIALLSSVLPYSFELIALRRIEPRVFGVLMSLEPAVAAVAGFIVLGEALDALEIGGMGFVVLASAMVLVTSSTGGERSVAEAAEMAEIG